MEQASGKHLSWFFAQWLTRSGGASARGQSAFDRAAKQLVVELTQTQLGQPYRLPLEVGISMRALARLSVERLETTHRKDVRASPSTDSVADATLDRGMMLMEMPVFTASIR